MNKKMKQSASLLAVILLVGCASIATHPTTEHKPISTEKAFALTKAFGITAEAETETEVSPKSGATVTAIVATKFAGATEMAATMAAIPTLTATPAIPTDSPPCAPVSLKTSFGSNGATGNILLGASFTNISPSPCFMQAWPSVILADRQGNPLDVDYGYFDFGTDASGAATEQARDSATARVGLWPGWTAWISLMWGNWCEKPVTGGVLIRLTLPNHLGTINISTDISAGGTCNASSYRSYVGISNLNVAPPPK